MPLSPSRPRNLLPGPAFFAATGVLLLSVAGAAVLVEELQHWFLLPVALCGVLLASDAMSWLLGRVDLLDPVGLLAVFGLHFFVLAPLLHVAWGHFLPWVEPPPDWREWLGAMAALNAFSLLFYRLPRWFRREISVENRASTSNFQAELDSANKPTSDPPTAGSGDSAAIIAKEQLRDSSSKFSRGSLNPLADNQALEPGLSPELGAETDTELETETSRDLETETRSELEPESKSALETETNPALEPEANSELGPESKSALETETNPDLENETNPAPEPETNSELKPESNPARETELDSELDAESNPDPNPDPEPEPNSELNPEPNPAVGSELDREIASDIASDMDPDIDPDVDPAHAPAFSHEPGPDLASETDSAPAPGSDPRVDPSHAPSHDPELTPNPLNIPTSPFQSRQNTIWQLESSRFAMVLGAALAGTLVLQFWLLSRFGGLSGIIQSYSDPGSRSAAFVGLGWVLMFSESLPILLFFGFVVWSRRHPELRGWGVVVGALLAFVALQMLFGGLRGSRSNTIWALFWAGSLIHLLVRPLPRKFAALGLVALLVFMYGYGFYKSFGSEAIQALEGSEERARLVERSGRGIPAVLLGDLGRADIQAFILYRQGHPDVSWQPALGRTYLGALALFVPRQIWPDRPQTKVKEGTEIQYGPGLAYFSDYRSSRVYGLAGEAMLNFGPWGVPAAFLLLGVLLDRVRMLFRRWSESGDSRILLLPLLINLCFVALASDLDNLLFFLVKNGFLPFVVVALASRRVRQEELPWS